MSNNLKITVLSEERADRSGLVAEHGWAVWIETDNKRILFDVGQRNEMLLNANHLGIDICECDEIVLSHGHYDHSGGLESVWSMVPNKMVYAHPVSLAEKYARNDDGTSRYNGMPQSTRDLLNDNPDRLIATSKPTALGSGLFVTGEIPRVTEFEDAGGAYFIDPHCLYPDPIVDDQALFFESIHGIVVILGCAHAGVINTVKYIRKLTGGKNIHAVIGGMHLFRASEKRIRSTMQAMRDYNLSLLGTAHCTGTAATYRMQAAFSGRCLDCCVGTQLVFD